jgi:hypothetical protein
VVALHATTKLLGVNPFHDLRKNGFASAHFASLARVLLAENTNFNPYRSHLKNAKSTVFEIGLGACYPAKRDGNDAPPWCSKQHRA